MENTLLKEESNIPKKNIRDTGVPLTFINAEPVKGVRVNQRLDIVAEHDTFNEMSGDGDTI